MGFGRGITHSDGDVKNNFFDRYRLYVSGLVFHNEEIISSHAFVFYLVIHNFFFFKKLPTSIFNEDN